jgi:hypothetical protein
MLECVASSTTCGALSASNASTQRSAQTHQRSPACKPANPNSGRGVDRSLPRAFENARNSAVISAHTVCTPVSSAPVSQQPVR